MKRTLRIALPIVVFGMVVGLWALYPAWIGHRYTMDDSAKHGDMFGGLNALFSGLAFAGLIYTILLQREELSLQRKELELTREELRRSAKANEETARCQAKQIETQLLAARISGISALVNSCNGRLADISRENESFAARGQHHVSVDDPETRQLRKQLESELTQLLSDIKPTA